MFSELSLDDSVISTGANRVDTKLIHFLIHSGLFPGKTTLNTHIKFNISANVMNRAVLVKISFK